MDRAACTDSKQPVFCAPPDKGCSPPVMKKMRLEIQRLTPTQLASAGYSPKKPHSALHANSEKPGFLTRKIEKLTAQHRSFNIIAADSNQPVLKYHSSDTYVDLNGLTRFLHAEGLPDKINCSALAYGYATGQFATGRNKFTDIDSPEKMRSHPYFRNNTPEKNLDAIPKQALYFELSQFSQTLKQLADDVFAHTAPYTQTFLFVSVVHGMALRIKRSQHHLTLCFYDPNYTTRHTRILCQNPDSCSQLTLHHLLPANDIQDYFPDPKQIATLFSPESVDSQSQFQSHGQMIIKATYFAGLLQKLLSHNHFMPGMHINDFEMTPCLSLGYGLHIALTKGHTESIERCTRQVIEESTLPEHLRIQFLKGLSPSHCPALFKALAQRSLKSVVRFMNIILNSDQLNMDQKQQIVCLPFVPLRPPLLNFLFYRRPESVTTYMQGIFSCKLTEVEKMMIIEARDVQQEQQGEARLMKAPSDANPAALDSFSMAIEESGFSPENKGRLRSYLSLFTEKPTKTATPC